MLGFDIIMISAFKKILDKIKSQRKGIDAVTYPNPPEIDFTDLEHNFFKRTYSFAYYKKQYLNQNSRLLHWIGSIDYSGYQREKSLNYLINNYQPGDENRILLRLEDWVDNVQKIARDWVFSFFNTLSLEQINAQHRLILYLARKEKLCGDNAIRVINETIIKKATETKDYAFYKLDTKLRRYIYNLVDTQNSQYRQRIISDKDPFNRIILLQKFKLEELSSEEREILKNDKSSFVKRNFLYFQINKNTIPSQEHLISFCLDDNKGIRNLAKFWLKKSYGYEPYDLYKKQDGYKYYFIADYAKSEDLDIFASGFKSNDQKIKNLCFKAICNIDYSRLKNMKPIEFLSSNRTIRKLAYYYLPKILSLNELHSLHHEISSIGSNGQLVYLNMIYKKSIWYFIQEALETLVFDPSDENIKFISNKYFRKPYIYEKLKPQLKDSILRKIDTLKTSENNCIKTFIKHLSFTIKTT
ncbi:hypothetical protein BVX93_01265 [bacterium B13(2017)]|nr:hypothetical protein BVX93_01265 [bacterium B13(2017)]